MQKYAVLLKYTKAEHEKQALEVIMETIYSLLQNDASLDNIGGENNGNFRGSS